MTSIGAGFIIALTCRRFASALSFIYENNRPLGDDHGGSRGSEDIACCARRAQVKAIMLIDMC
jgi:hypothetical protein